MGVARVGFRGEALQRYSVTVIFQGCIFFKNNFIYIYKYIYLYI